jgi:hypothetical protein
LACHTGYIAWRVRGWDRSQKQLLWPWRWQDEVEQLRLPAGSEPGPALQLRFSSYILEPVTGLTRGHRGRSLLGQVGPCGTELSLEPSPLTCLPPNVNQASVSPPNGNAGVRGAGDVVPPQTQARPAAKTLHFHFPGF